MSTEKKIEYGPITTKKMAKNVWVAETIVTKPMKSTVTMKGNSEQNAIDKLLAFLNEK